MDKDIYFATIVDKEGNTVDVVRLHADSYKDARRAIMAMEDMANYSIGVLFAQSDAYDMCSTTNHEGAGPITAAGVWNVNGERILVIETRDSVTGYWISQFEDTDFFSANSPEDDDVRAFCDRIIRDGVDGWTIEDDPVAAQRCLTDLDYGVAVTGSGEGW